MGVNLPPVSCSGESEAPSKGELDLPKCKIYNTSTTICVGGQRDDKIINVKVTTSFILAKFGLQSHNFNPLSRLFSYFVHWMLNHLARSSYLIAGAMPATVLGTE